MNDLPLVLNDTSKKYLQIYRQIKKLIVEGKISPEEKLPSKRRLSESLGVAKNTIMLAYDLLLQEGYISSKDRSGYYVEDNRYYRTIVQKSQIPLAKKIKYDFTSSNVDKNIFPYYTLRKITNSLMLDNNALWLEKSSYQGDISLRETIANYLYENKGMEVNSSNVIITSSLEESLSIISSLIKVDTFGIEDPSYLKVYSYFKDKKIVLFDVDNQGIVLNKNEHINLLYLTPYNQFPCGVKMSVSRKKAVLQYPLDYILEDDFDCDLNANKVMSTLYSLNNEKVIYHGSFTHTICPGIRISYLVLPPHLMERYQSLYASRSSQISSLDQRIISEFISKGYYYRYLTKLKKTLANKKIVVESYLKKYNYDYKKTELSFLVNVDNAIVESNIKKYDLKANFISDFSLSKKDDKRLIINYLSLDEKELQSALDLLLK